MNQKMSYNLKIASVTARQLKPMLHKKVTNAHSSSNRTRVISITSGKGGVGKTHTTTNLGIGLANLLNKGRSVLILDADLGLANVDVLLGIKPKGNLHDVLKGKLNLDDILLEGPGGISIIPSASGIEEIQSLRSDQKLFLMEEIERVAHRFDYLLIDTSAGISQDVMYFNSAASEVICVITGEPTSLTDTYALIKVLNAKYGEKNISVVVNNVASEKEAQKSFDKLSSALERYLHINIEYLGWVPSDQQVRECVMLQKAIVSERPSSIAGRALSNIASKVDDQTFPVRVKGGMQFFFSQLLEVSAHG